MNQKKSVLLLAGIAAIAYYKYNKMSPEEKAKITDTIKETGQKIIDNLPNELKNLFGDKAKSQHV